MMIQSKKFLARAVAAALAGQYAALLAPQVACAQEAVPEAAKSSSILEEVVVTAQRRTQALQDVPIAVQVVSNDLINDVGGREHGRLEWVRAGARRVERQPDATEVSDPRHPDRATSASAPTRRSACMSTACTLRAPAHRC